MNEVNETDTEKQHPVKKRIKRTNSLGGSDVQNVNCFLKVFSCGRTNITQQKEKLKKKA
jgi:hypothetical protein